MRDISLSLSSTVKSVMSGWLGPAALLTSFPMLSSQVPESVIYELIVPIKQLNCVKINWDNNSQRNHTKASTHQQMVIVLAAL